jgi:predicted membrane chloride channel (bestrophin family)
MGGAGEKARALPPLLQGVVMVEGDHPAVKSDMSLCHYMQARLNAGDDYRTALEATLVEAKARKTRTEEPMSDRELDLITRILAQQSEADAIIFSTLQSVKEILDVLAERMAKVERRLAVVEKCEGSPRG